MKTNDVHVLLIFILILLLSSTVNQAQMIFQKDYSGSNSSIGYSICTENDGFVIAGEISGSGQGGKDVLLMKTDLDGNVIWAKSIGGFGDEVARSIKKTSDGGYILVGSTSSYVFPPADTSNVYVVKTNNDGDIQWIRSIGAYATEDAYDVIETYDHKYAIVGFTHLISLGQEDIFFLPTIQCLQA